LCLEKGKFKAFFEISAKYIPLVLNLVILIDESIVLGANSVILTSKSVIFGIFGIDMTDYAT